MAPPATAAAAATAAAGAASCPDPRSPRSHNPVVWQPAPEQPALGREPSVRLTPRPHRFHDGLEEGEGGPLSPRRQRPQPEEEPPHEHNHRRHHLFESPAVAAVPTPAAALPPGYDGSGRPVGRRHSADTPGEEPPLPPGFDGSYNHADDDGDALSGEAVGRSVIALPGAVGLRIKTRLPPASPDAVEEPPAQQPAQQQHHQPPLPPLPPPPQQECCQQHHTSVMPPSATPPTQLPTGSPTGSPPARGAGVLSPTPQPHLGPTDPAEAAQQFLQQVLLQHRAMLPPNAASMLQPGAAAARSFVFVPGAGFLPVLSTTDPAEQWAALAAGVPRAPGLELPGCFPLHQGPAAPPQVGPAPPSPRHGAASPLGWHQAPAAGALAAAAAGWLHALVGTAVWLLLLLAPDGGISLACLPAGRRAAGPRRPTCEVRLPGVHTLSEALLALQRAIRRAVPAEEPGAAAKRALLAGLLQRGLSKVGLGIFAQSPVNLAQAGWILHEVRGRVGPGGGPLLYAACPTAAV